MSKQPIYNWNSILFSYSHRKYNLPTERTQKLSRLMIAVSGIIIFLIGLDGVLK